MLKIKNLNKKFGNHEILKNINLNIKEGEFLTLVGESGSGKSTLLRIIAGLEEPSKGEILNLNNQDISKQSPKDRNFSMVFQNYALYPHLSVKENLAMPIKARAKLMHKLPFASLYVKSYKNFKMHLEEKIEHVAKKLKISHILDKKPKQLSEGQCQRVALGRAIIREPSIFLMDEPLSNLDAKLRIHTRAELSAIHKELNKTFIYVTHDQSEAMTMSDRIAFLVDGELLQVGSPDEMYNNPNHLKVAQFIGTPTINTLSIELKSFGFSLSKKYKTKILAIRAENCFIDPYSKIQAKIYNIENMGNEYLIYTKLLENDNDFILSVSTQEGKKLEINCIININFDYQKSFIFDEEGKRMDIKPYILSFAA
ncbi:ABC transporter ATP-binding protein [Campylobacter hepaticus]|uniref:ABC transporter ATP-binding protein n=1 Tax=Campylobacter hepaticus TaxID=1813019 RepID=UPI0029B6322C|nr:ABC transporter ATP-binding protein [Campylobacter hepaticus]MDX2331527.1 ABC transporter ATP-binding protein [Campylobacter hepaticus]MDX2372073.1 ABC transporter ATP-binding protein [Campylobacter hepaticus]MDX2397380.1 ABC transporter ATP-binding protein [Campylobacter hepaticus]MDX5509230.1 ABC transporter ATP-binding protein [Campylobacter hepaticus]